MDQQGIENAAEIRGQDKGQRFRRRIDGMECFVSIERTAAEVVEPEDEGEDQDRSKSEGDLGKTILGIHAATDLCPILIDSHQISKKRHADILIAKTRNFL